MPELGPHCIANARVLYNQRTGTRIAQRIRIWHAPYTRTRDTVTQSRNDAGRNVRRGTAHSEHALATRPRGPGSPKTETPRAVHVGNLRIARARASLQGMPCAPTCQRTTTLNHGVKLWRCIVASW